MDTPSRSQTDGAGEEYGDLTFDGLMAFLERNRTVLQEPNFGSEDDED